MHAGWWKLEDEWLQAVGRHAVRKKRAVNGRQLTLIDDFFLGN